MIFRLLMVLATTVGSVSAAAATYQDLDALDARIASTLDGAQSPVPIDRRIRLASCPEEPEISPVAAGAVSVRCGPLGWKIRVAVNGSSPAAVPAAIVVRRGDPVEIIARGAGFSVSSSGTALDEGSAGKTIRVKIPTSTSPVPAVVVRAGVASISG
jgi:flagella basal body P-ring formation protein FlgA